MVAKLLPLLALFFMAVTAQKADNTISANVVALSGDAAGASKEYRFNTLVALATQAKLVDALNTPNITLFAPTDAAFKALAAEAVPTDPQVVGDVLTHHVVAGAYPADALKAYQVVNTLLNRKGSPFVQFADDKTAQAIAITKGDKGVSVSYGLGAVKVIDSIPSSNGIIHVVDAVIMPPKKVSETAVAAKLTKLVEALAKVKLVETVNGLKGATIFAPTDAAFEKVKDVVAKLTDDQLKAVLTYHVVPAVAYSPGLPASLDAPTLSGSDKIAVKSAGGKVTANKANVAVADVFTNNGVVHVIDEVLIPASLSGGASSSSGSSTSTAGAKPAATATATGTPISGASMNAAGASAALVAAAAALFA
ncbi:hypothetical protein H9P43_004595 [Blastocladiella emersonii ATCC 22665]|nr:hypothetical protein H9P43_004595 [Blastocladiella emersonii ATCC 22665]